MEPKSFTELLQEAFRRRKSSEAALAGYSTVRLENGQIVILPPTTKITFQSVYNDRTRRKEEVWNAAVLTVPSADKPDKYREPRNTIVNLFPAGSGCVARFM